MSGEANIATAKGERSRRGSAARRLDRRCSRAFLGHLPSGSSACTRARTVPRAYRSVRRKTRIDQRPFSSHAGAGRAGSASSASAPPPLPSASCPRFHFPRGVFRSWPLSYMFLIPRDHSCSPVRFAWLAGRCQSSPRPGFFRYSVPFFAFARSPVRLLPGCEVSAVMWKRERR